VEPAARGQDRRSRRPLRADRLRGGRSELLFFDRHDGRRALFMVDLANDRERRLVFAHPSLDVAGVSALGKHERLVGAGYVEDRPHLHFFDPRIEEIHGLLLRQFPGQMISVADESWDQRFYLVFASTDREPGSHYRLDADGRQLLRIARAYPALAARELAPMQAIRYRAEDGVEIPIYLTLPPGSRPEGLSAVILPHGGPSARDYWSYDFLVQFLAANGYAVLQSNYRGSAGYGADWEGEGGFRQWRRAVADITAGARHLIREAQFLERHIGR
jgi:dipeptidyl aminopeptidase/acylaminoacyl peptidase